MIVCAIGSAGILAITVGRGENPSKADHGQEKHLNHDKIDRRHAIASQIDDAVRSIQRKEAEILVLRGVGEVHLRGQHADVDGHLSATVFLEQDDKVTRQTILLDDVISVDVESGGHRLPEGSGHFRHPSYVAPSTKDVTVMELVVAALLGQRRVDEIFADRGLVTVAEYALTGEIPPALWHDPKSSLRQPLQQVLRRLPELVRLRVPLAETSIAHPGNSDRLIEPLRETGMLAPGVITNPSSLLERTLVRKDVQDALLHHCKPMLAGEPPVERPPLPDDVVDVLDAAMVLAGTVARFIETTKPFAKRAALREHIEGVLGNLFESR